MLDSYPEKNRRFTTFSVRATPAKDVRAVEEALFEYGVIMLSTDTYTPNTNIEYGHSDKTNLRQFLKAVEDLEVSLKAITEFYWELALPTQSLTHQVATLSTVPMFNCLLAIKEDVMLVRSKSRTSIRLFIEFNVNSNLFATLEAHRVKQTWDQYDKLAEKMKFR